MVERFRKAVRELCPEGPYVLAVSGGGDSVALAVLAKRAGLEAVIAHLDHGLRPESGEDVAFVQALARRLGYPVYIERVDVAAIARKRGENLEAVARELRYAFLARVAREVGAACILTAHSADDQAETVLFQLFTGTARALGIRKKRGQVARPLLGFRRQELRRFLLEEGFGWREDATNADLSRDRAYLRHEVLPRVEARFPGAVPALMRFAEVRQQEEDDLEPLAAARLIADDRFFVPAVRAAPLVHAPATLRRRALRRFLEGAGLRPEARFVEALEAALGGRRQNLPGGYLARGYAGALFLIPPKPKPPPLPHGLSPCAYQKDLRLQDGGRLDELFRAHGVPPELRPSWPLACEAGRVVYAGELYPEPPELRWMRRVLALARSAGRRGEVPIAALVVQNGEVLAEATNAVEKKGDPTAHAELLAIQLALASTGEKRLFGATLVVNLEPCPMCYGALMEAGVRTLVWGTENLKAGAFSVHALPPKGLVLRPGRLAGASAKLLSGFFARLRSEGCRSG